ncbi:MAG: hypothetical protein ABJB74_07905 [Gemmatimonas sp.]
MNSSALFRHSAHAVRLLLLTMTLPVFSTWSVPPFTLPAPTGRYGVGTTSWNVTDPDRRESIGALGGARQVKVYAWYPTVPITRKPSGQRAPYLRETIAEARTFALLYRDSSVFDHLEGVQTHAILDDTLVGGTARLPVLIFSHGYTGLVSAYTALLEDLASCGFIVLSIAHPYEVVATRLSDGSLVTIFDSAGHIRPELLDVVNEWAVEDSTMAMVTHATTDAEQLRILRGYLSGNSKTREAIDRWVKDTKLVLDQLPQLPRRSIGGQLDRHGDFAHLGVFGHSMGGVVAGQFCVEDSRCRAGLNLDGIPQSGTMIDAKMKAPFLMVYSARPGRLGASDVIYRRAASTYYRVDVDNTLHADFSDMIYWRGPLHSGTIDPDRATALTRLIVRQYFMQELQDIKSPLLNGSLTLPDARLHKQR